MRGCWVGMPLRLFFIPFFGGGFWFFRFLCVDGEARAGELGSYFDIWCVTVMGVFCLLGFAGQIYGGPWEIGLGQVGMMSPCVRSPASSEVFGSDPNCLGRPKLLPMMRYRVSYFFPMVLTEGNARSCIIIEDVLSCIHFAASRVFSLISM